MLKELERIKAREEKARQQRIALLRRELDKATERVEALRRELRMLGDPEAARSAGKIDWGVVYDRLGPTFTARAVAELTGVRPSHAATICHRWLYEGRTIRLGRGKYRKRILGTAGRRNP